MEGKRRSPRRRSYSLSRRLSRRQVWHWFSAGPVQWRHLAWQALHSSASLSQYSTAAHSVWGTQPPWLFTLRPSWHVVQAPEDEQVRQVLGQSAGRVGTAHERERESGHPRGNQFLEKCARHPCSEISRALCQGCGARSWALGWSILVARREKKCLVHFLCNPQAVPPCSSHLRDVSKSCHNYPNCSMIITSSSVAAESHTSLWASHHCNCSSVVLCWPPSSLSLLLT